MTQRSYHYLIIKEVLKLFQTNPSGLSHKQAQLRLEKYGPNRLPEEKKLSSLILFLHQFRNPLIYILFIAAIISFLTKHFVDVGIIFTVILVSSIVAFLQEYKANKALSQIKKLVKFHTKLLREGKEVVVPQETIVPGDIILLSPGDKVPADARLIEAHNFEVIEAALTGESAPSGKKTHTLPKDIPLADRENMVYMGTVVARGKAKAIVVSTGQHTQLGHIATLVKETEEEQTPLQKQLAEFGKTLGLILIVLNFIIFFLGILTNKPLFEMFLTSVAVIVAAVPEGLLPAMTVILAIGMQRLVNYKGLIRRMVAAETLGSVTVICSDKTGTLTQGEMRVSHVITQTTKFSYDGQRFLPKSRYKSQTIASGAEASHIVALKIGLLCNNAVIKNPDEELKDWVVVGDPTEKALLLAARAAGLKKQSLEKNEPRVAEIPFESDYKFMATLHAGETEDKENYTIYTKGAPEKIIASSSYIDMEGKKATLGAEERKTLQKHYEDLTGVGLRVLAVAYKTADKSTTADNFTRQGLDGLTFVGLIAIKDPLRLEAKETIDVCQNAGIRPVIVTGDHALTATAIVRELGIFVSKEEVMQGEELDQITDEQLRKKVNKIVIFARVEPRHKIRIISAFQANGEVVAMTGDGVNDAPALKKADIGIAIGSGTDVTKEVADMVLLDDNFKIIIEAVKRGRITFNNIRKVILYLLTDSFTEMILVGSSVILHLPLPILPAQILWIKLIEDAAPAMSLAFDEIDEGVMQEPPRGKTEPILSRNLKKLIAFYALIMDFVLFAMFFFFWKTSGNLAYARTITFVGLGLTSLFYIFSVRGFKISILKMNPFSNKFLVTTTIVGLTLFAVAIYMPFFNQILQTVPLGIKEWLVLGSFGFMSIFVYELGKKLFIAEKSKPGFD